MPGELCHCGRERKDHENLRDENNSQAYAGQSEESSAHETNNGKWNADIHTYTEKSTAFGSIKFVGFGKESSKKSAMVRIDL